MKIKLLITVGLLMLTINLVQAQDKWELRRDENGISIFSRHAGKIVELRLLCEFDAPPEQLAKQVLDIPAYTNWVYGNKRTGIIKKITEHDIIYFTEAHLPWPIQDRDLVLELNLTPATATTPLTIQAKSIEGMLPPKPHFIRVPYSLATWRISPAAGNKTKLDYTFSLDPGGSIPGWLVDLTIATGPYKSFMKLQEIVKAANSKYTQN